MLRRIADLMQKRYKVRDKVYFVAPSARSRPSKILGQDSVPTPFRSACLTFDTQD